MKLSETQIRRLRLKLGQRALNLSDQDIQDIGLKIIRFVSAKEISKTGKENDLE